VLVEGTIGASAWKGRDGEPRATLELRADRVVFLGGRGEAAPAEGGTVEAGPTEAVGEDELPF
jgi:single-stranded DNA-binding protein